MPRTHSYDAVHELALDQHGVFTAQQARELGVETLSLTKMVNRGKLERIAYGLFRDVGAPVSRWTQYASAVLWPRGVVGLLSHETLLSVLELSDVNPATVHVTVPKNHRPRRRQPPPWMTLHYADVPEEQTMSVEGLPATTVARAVQDCAAAHLGASLLRQALEDGQAKGYLTGRQVLHLRTEVLHGD